MATQVKVFEEYTAKDLEKRLNEWLAERGDSITMIREHQSIGARIRDSTATVLYVVSIWFEEKNHAG